MRVARGVCVMYMCDASCVVCFASCSFAIKEVDSGWLACSARKCPGSAGSESWCRDDRVQLSRPSGAVHSVSSAPIKSHPNHLIALPDRCCHSRGGAKRAACPKAAGRFTVKSEKPQCEHGHYLLVEHHRRADRGTHTGRARQPERQSAGGRVDPTIVVAAHVAEEREASQIRKP